MLYVILCDVLLYCIVLYCTVLYCPVLHCRPLLPGINPFAVNNNNNKFTIQSFNTFNFRNKKGGK